jgi:monothiol glutaredoxin
VQFFESNGIEKCTQSSRRLGRMGTIQNKRIWSKLSGMKTTDKIRKQLSDHPVILYMKGTPDEPLCGFSAKAAAVMKETQVSFAHVDVLASPLIMEALPEVSDFPTFPQLFINGEIIGGSDIVEAMYQSGELLPMLKAATEA